MIIETEPGSEMSVAVAATLTSIQVAAVDASGTVTSTATSVAFVRVGFAYQFATLECT